MSVVRFIPNVNRLAQAMAGPGGKKASEAIADAEAAVQAIAPPCIEAVDEALAAIVARMQTPGAPSAEAKADLYRNANAIHSLGGLFGLEDMGLAAYSLCELIDVTEGDPPSTRAAIDAHVRSLQLLRGAQGLSSEARGAILAGLEKLLSHVRAETA